MDFIEIDDEEVKLSVPSSIVVSGPTSSGKTFWVYNFLKSKDILFKGRQPPVKILFCYSINQDLYLKIKDEIPGVDFHEGLPDLETIYQYTTGEHILIVLDDLVHKLLDNNEMLLLFTQVSHHRKVSVVFMTQNIFHSGKNARSIALNVKYIVLFANPRDSNQVKFLGRQIFPGNSNRLYEAYSDATKSKWGYLLVDLTPNTPDNLRLRSGLFPSESNMVVYEPK